MALWVLLALGPASITLSADADLERKLRALVRSHRGDVAVAVKHLESETSFFHAADRPMPTASLIKLPIMIETYRQAAAGDVDLDQLIRLREQDKVPGSGILTEHFSAGSSISLRDAVRLMIRYSDNTATNLVIDQIGLRSTSDTMQKMGLPHTKLHAKVYRADTSIFPARSKQFGLGSTTARETLSLLERLHAGQMVNSEASAAMIVHLQHCDDKIKLPRFLPAGTRIAHKTGSVTRSKCAAGIIYSPGGAILVCVLTTNNQDRRWIDDNAGNRLCAEVAKAVYEHFNQSAQPAADRHAGETLQQGDTGELVEALQRTLNRRLDSTPGLSVDGDFGPNTERAVREFQRAHDLKDSGIVDGSTWQALGTLLMKDEPVPSPSVVNTRTLRRNPADSLTGPPHVTCKAWAIADGTTGELLWSYNSDQPLDFASTTKIMTAYVVLRLADNDPNLLKQQLVFSARADNTNGSTAAVRAGEKLPVHEALYGLLLPSGNDASVALAEHFGSRFAPAEGSPQTTDAVSRFVAEMNRAARELRMSQTKYQNTSGLTAKGHVASAADLVKLAYAAMQMPKFRQYVSTREHGCTLIGPGGYRRNVVWKNTNQLLPTEGYNGVKTGTTSAAGACLVSSCQRNGRELLIVTLGSSSSAARYADTKNLFRWAWQNLPHPE